MWLWLQRLHRWQLEKVFGEWRWEFPLCRGYEYFDAVLSEQVHKVARLRFQQSFDYSLRRGFYGYWDRRNIYIRIKLPSTRLREFFGTARGSHFKGKISKSDSGLTLVGSYRLTNIMKIMPLICIYLPLILLIYGACAIFYLVFQYIQTGETVEVFEVIMGFLTIAFGMGVFWSFGYVMGQFHARSTWREREKIYGLLKLATS